MFKTTCAVGLGFVAGRKNTRFEHLGSVVSRLEPTNTPGTIDNFLFAGIKRMAFRADFNV